MIELFFSTYISSSIRFLFLLAPFFVVTMFFSVNSRAAGGRENRDYSSCLHIGAGVGCDFCFLPVLCCFGCHWYLLSIRSALVQVHCCF